MITTDAAEGKHVSWPHLQPAEHLLLVVLRLADGHGVGLGDDGDDGHGLAQLVHVPAHTRAKQLKNNIVGVQLANLLWALHPPPGLTEHAAAAAAGVSSAEAEGKAAALNAGCSMGALAQIGCYAECCLGTMHLYRLYCIVTNRYLHAYLMSMGLSLCGGTQNRHTSMRGSSTCQAQ
jgi:hypothetical protein